MDFEFGFSRSRATPREDRPFRLLVLADLSGAAPRAPLATRKPIRIEVDQLDDRMEAIRPLARITIGEPPLEIEVSPRTMDDFHPDELYRTLPVFDELRKTRRRLSDPTTFAQAAAELQGFAAAPAAKPPASRPTDGGSFEQLLGGSPPTAAGGGALDALLRSAVAGCIVPAPDPRQPDMIASIDRAVTMRMRDVLHAPGFRRLEMAWRCLHMLLTSIETGDEVSIHVLDVSREELLASLAGRPDPLLNDAATAILKTATTGADALGWSLIVGGEVDATPDGAALASALGAMARAAGGHALLGGCASLASCPSFASAPDAMNWTQEWSDDARQAWDDLKASEPAHHVSILAPRFILRAPYAPGGEEIDSFSFAEFDAAPIVDLHERFAWAPSSVLGAIAIAAAFQQSGFPIDPATMAGRIDSLPVFTWKEQGEAHMLAAAEAYLSERAASALSQAGLTPVMSHRQFNAAEVWPLRSLAGTPVALT